jgi:hypothetical protein
LNNVIFTKYAMINWKINGDLSVELNKD